MEQYRFRPYQEAAFAGTTALTILGFETLASFDAAVLGDPQTYFVALGGAAARAFGAAALNAFIRYVAGK